MLKDSELARIKAAANDGGFPWAAGLIARLESAEDALLLVIGGESEAAFDAAHAHFQQTKD